MAKAKKTRFSTDFAFGANRTRKRTGKGKGGKKGGGKGNAWTAYVGRGSSAPIPD
jgi:hypothetical protein